ncbi:uncharacterized protein N7477_007969 [Penicillium maclennaniae]|uniref:uncharacterized protein n=1 Tax=Penicillium maclennaniae TaxID=1343394 RepID=UPI002541F354|nr:uncharacterized protein N7477_007969 [Penicillium maclennaniae]KAJ5665521.1 hypothetical protein N7477_007969 [Penicillium maclennaniae]
MADPTFFRTLFDSVNRSEGIVELWNNLKSQESHEAEEQEDMQDGICDLVLEISDPDAFNNEYAHLSGLAALPRPGRVHERTSAAPKHDTAKLAGRAEVSLRTAMRFDRVGLIETEEEEPDWDAQTGQPFFAGWDALVPYQLPESRNIVQEVVDNHQERWDNAKINVDAGVGGGGLEGFFGIIHGWFHPTEWISLYRAKTRNIYAWAGRNASNSEDSATLASLESQLFDITKYRGTSEYMTVLTYGESYYGVATLLRVSLKPQEELALILEPLAMMKDVPKQVLQIMQGGVSSIIKLVQRGDKIRCIETGGQDYAAPALITTVGTTRRGKMFKVPWDIGDGWRHALGIQHDQAKEKNGIVATIPQMMALLHLKGSGLHDLESSPMEGFSVPLEANPHKDDNDQLAPRWEIRRGLKILHGPQREGHFGNKVTVAVIFPQDSLWAREKVLWA